MVHTAEVVLCIAPRHRTTVSVAVTQNVFLFKEFLVSLDKTWRYSCYQFGDQVKLEMADYLCDRTTAQKTGLAQIKETAEPDFTLECDEEQTAGVHRCILEGLWPYFQGMMGSNMKEVAEKRIKLSMPKSTLEALLRYLYGEKLSLEFNDAANLIVYAQMYELTELLLSGYRKGQNQRHELFSGHHSLEKEPRSAE